MSKYKLNIEQFLKLINGRQLIVDTKASNVTLKFTWDNTDLKNLLRCYLTIKTSKLTNFELINTELLGILNSKLINTHLYNNFISCRVRKSYFENCIFEETTFSEFCISNSRFVNCEFINCEFDSVRFLNVKLRNTFFKSCTFFWITPRMLLKKYRRSFHGCEFPMNRSQPISYNPYSFVSDTDT